MKYAVITIGRSGSSTLIQKLSSVINIVQKPDNHLYPNKLLEKYGKNIKVIFLTRNIKDVIKSVLQREKDRGIEWIKKHYKNLNSNFGDYHKILEKDTFNFEKLYDSYNKQDFFDVLFIKYECLYFNNKDTIDALCKFTNLESINIVNNTNNSWKGNYKDQLKIELLWDKSLQKKLDCYNFKLYLKNNILKLRTAGFGSNINQIIISCILVEKKIIEPFYIIWDTNCYHKSDIFLKYFTQPFYNTTNISIHKNYNIIDCYTRGYITPRYPNINNKVSKEILLPPNNRTNIKLIIDKYIKINKNIKNIANKFINNYKNIYKIGIHCRGNGRIHGGINTLMKLSNEKESYYVEKVKNHIKNLNNKSYVIIIFTDNIYSLNYFKKHLNNINRYDSTIANNNFGEIHKSKKDIKIFEDILIETEIMADMDYLVHGNSNITNYVLCKNPHLKAYDIYNNFYKKSIKIAHLINPFKYIEDNPSYLYYTLPVTFNSMYNAQLEAYKIGLDIKLYTINYSEDNKNIPEYFIKLPNLKESIISKFQKIYQDKKLQIIQKIFDSILQNSDANYIIITNSDIKIQKNFYKKVNELIINKREKIPIFKNNQKLTQKDLDRIYNKKDKKYLDINYFIIMR